MAISLKHLFQSAKTDGPDNTIVQPSDWNDEHVLTQATNRLLGRTTAGTGATEEIAPGTGITLSAGTLSADVTSVAGRTGAVTLSTADISGLTTGYVQKTSATGSAYLPAGTTGQREGSPSAGYIRYNTTTGKFEGYGSSWGNIGGGAAIGDTPPANPGAGDLWWNSADGRMYVYYTDANSSQWVDLSAGGAGQYLPLTGGTVTGDVSVTGNFAYTGTLTGGTGVINIGSGQFYKDASGNVGIGTSSPAQKLSVNGITGANLFQITTNSSVPVVDAAVYRPADGTLGFVSNGSERARIDSSGNVSIGTATSGGYRLRVDGTTGAYVSTTGSNNAIYGYSSSTGVGVFGQSASNYGVYGLSTNSNGGYFVSTNNHGIIVNGLYYAVYAQTTASSYGGVLGYSQNGSYYGISGYANYYSFYGNGNASITNGTWGTSDIRFKEIVDDNPFAIGGPYDRSALDIISSIPVRAYRLKGPMADTSINGLDQFGWIAQEVEAVLPLAVTETPIPPNDIKTRAWIAGVPVPEKDSAEEEALVARDDLRYKSLNKDYLIAALWGAVQELKAEIDILKGGE